MAEYLVQDTSLTAVADAIRAKTGGSAPLAFPAGMVDAIAGITSGGSSGGGGLKYASGSWTPASDTNLMVVEFDFVPVAASFALDDYTNKATDGVSKVTDGVYFKGRAATQRTNSSGASVGQFIGTTTPDTRILPDDTTVLSPYIIRPRSAGGFNIYHNYMFRGGYTYNWEAMGE